jgi:hypothetical protein
MMILKTELLACIPCHMQLRDLLDGAEAEAASSGGGAAPEAPAGAEQVAAQVEQLQVAEVSGDTVRQYTSLHITVHQI